MKDVAGKDAQCTDVALRKRADYSQGLAEAIEELVGLLGGFDAFITPGDQVLVKPNLVRANRLNTCTCTDPAFISAVCEILLDHRCSVTVGDSPMIGSAQSVAASIGLDERLKRLGVPLIGFKKNSTPPETGIIKNRKFKSLEIADELKDFDVVINLPKLKTHVQTGVTLAVKNVYGCIAGEKKKLLHLLAGDGASFSRLLLETAYTVRPALSILDGIRGMDLSGPAAGRPRNTGVILASRDPLALDRTVLEITGIRVERIGIFKEARNLFLQGTGMDEITVLGESPDSCRIQGFRAVHIWPIDFAGFHILYKPFIRLFGKRIIIDHERCTLCRTCERVCPAKAIELKNGKMTVDRRRCIRCCCCMEACPEHAVGFRRSLKGF